MNAVKTSGKPLIIGTTLFYLLNAGNGYAQETKAYKTEQKGSRLEEAVREEYNSVDDILGDLFEPVSSHNFYEKTDKGKCVVLFYNNDLIEGGDPVERLAKVFKAVAPDFKDQINFYKFEDDSDLDLARNGHIGLKKEYGVTGIPYYIFFKDGKKIFEHKGGPAEEQVPNDIGVMEKNLNELANM